MSNVNWPQWIRSLAKGMGGAGNKADEAQLNLLADELSVHAAFKEQPKSIVEDDYDYHKPDASGYSRADEEWFFDMDGKP